MKSIAHAALIAALFGTLDARATPPWITADSEINFDATGAKSEDYERRLRLDAHFRFEAALREGIKAVVKLRIEQALRSGKTWSALEAVDWAEALEAAYIRIETDRLSGLPRAIITLGKHEMAFGSEAKQTPLHHDNLFENLSEEDEVIGITVELPVKFFRIVDSVAVSLYETGADDFRISRKAGGAIRLRKDLGDFLEAQVSALVKENEGAAATEKRASAGLLVKTPTGYKLWAQGLLFDHHPELPTTTWGLQLGGSVELGPGAVIIDWEYLDRHAHELTLAYSLPLGTHLVIAPEIRFRHDLGGLGGDETRVGVRTRLGFSNRKTKLKGRPNDDD